MTLIAMRCRQAAALAALLALGACGSPGPTGPATIVGTGGLNHPDIATVPGTPSDLISPNN